ncbi:MAG TPA: cobalt-precorrin-6A reductase [Rhodospirillales bacterium]
MPSKTVLILGGTHEARELARRLTLEMGKRLRVITSLAGRRESKPGLAGEVRVGGFGGIAGLSQYLADTGVDLVVDATHPFSATISDHAGVACTGAGVPRLQLRRPAWRMPKKADWIEVASLAEAADILPKFARRVLLTTGARGIEAFAKLPGIWFLVRLIDAPKGPLPLARYEVVTGMPPYGLEDERALLKRHDIDTLVAKRSGGQATAAKITVAIEAKVKIVLIRRPPPEPGPQAETVDECLAWVKNYL